MCAVWEGVMLATHQQPANPNSPQSLRLVSHCESFCHPLIDDFAEARVDFKLLVK